MDAHSAHMPSACLEWLGLKSRSLQKCPSEDARTTVVVLLGQGKKETEDKDLPDTPLGATGTFIEVLAEKTLARSERSVRMLVGVDG